MRNDVAFVTALLLALPACDRTTNVSPPSSTGSPSAATSAQAPAKLEPPADLAPLSEVLKKAPGTRVKTRAFVWLMRPTCPPCPPNANCEPCPPAFFQFSEKPNTGAGAESGAVVLSDFDGSEPKLDLKTEYVLEGLLEDRPQVKPHVFLRIEKIAVLESPAK